MLLCFPLPLFLNIIIIIIISIFVKRHEDVTSEALAVAKDLFKPVLGFRSHHKCANCVVCVVHSASLFNVTEISNYGGANRPHVKQNIIRTRNVIRCLQDFRYTSSTFLLRMHAKT